MPHNNVPISFQGYPPLVVVSQYCSDKLEKLMKWGVWGELSLKHDFLFPPFPLFPLSPIPISIIIIIDRLSDTHHSFFKKLSAIIDQHWHYDP